MKSFKQFTEAKDDIVVTITKDGKEIDRVLLQKNDDKGLSKIKKTYKAPKYNVVVENKSTESI